MWKPRQLRVRNVASAGSNVWSASRYNANNAWYSNGNNGYANNNNLYNTYSALPVANYYKEMKLENLINDYLGCRSNKRRSTDSVYFELHWERDLARLDRDFQNRVIVPFLYAFLGREAYRPHLQQPDRLRS